MPGTWVSLSNQPTFNANHMMLLTDGTVLVQSLATNNWWKLSPDASGSYVNGTWTQLANSINGPTYYASAIMRDGRVFTAGGELDSSGRGDIDAAEIYDPIANTWTAISTPGWGWIGDAPACTLADSRIIMGSINDTRTAIYDPVANTWTAGPNKQNQSSEETWTLLPDGTVLTANVVGSPATEKYNPATNTWINCGNIPAGHELGQVTAASNEIGPAILRPDGTVFAMGASGHTAIYTPPANPALPGAWTAGPDFPNAGGQPQRAFDAPAVLLPNGNVLCIAGQAEASGWAGTPSNAFEFDGVNLNSVAGPPNATGVDTWWVRLLLLPTGEVLCSARSTNMQIYQPGGAPNPAWAPGLVNPPATIASGGHFAIHGTLLNGLSQANSYGDDAQMATNFPIVRITASDGHVHYCRTFGFSSMGTATGGAVLSANVAVPGSVPIGPATLCVIANGIASCVSVRVTLKYKDKLEKFEKLEKHEKIEKIEKIEKHEKIEKLEKVEKHEKFEIAENKHIIDNKQIFDQVKVIGDNIGNIGQGNVVSPASPHRKGEGAQKPFISGEERPPVGEHARKSAKSKHP